MKATAICLLLLVVVSDMTSKPLSGSADYLILTPKMFAEALQPLIHSKEALGLSVSLITIDEVQSQYMGRDIQEQLRECIKVHCRQFNTRWVLLVGKEDADDSPGNKTSITPAVLDKAWELPVRYVFLSRCRLRRGQFAG